MCRIKCEAELKGLLQVKVLNDVKLIWNRMLVIIATFVLPLVGVEISRYPNELNHLGP